MVPNPISGLFGQSPIKPIQQHMALAHACAEELKVFFQALLVRDWTAAEASQLTIVRLENEADDAKRDIRLSLPKSLFLPVPRTDLLDMLRMQDRIANEAKDIAGLMLGRRMEIPESMAADMMSYLDTAVATSAQALKAINELDELLEAGFRGREVDMVESLITELDNLENANDRAQVQVRAHLFTLEKQLPPVDVYFLYKVIDWVGQLANHAQKVGGRLQLVIAR